MKAMKRAFGGAVVALSLLVMWSAPALADYGGGTPPGAHTATAQVSASSNLANTLPTIPSSVLASGANRSGGTLPFTGGDIIGLVVIGLVLLVVGMVLHRAGRRRRLAA
jgi:hypothetical protein